jgi:hypothetical protein
LVRPETGKSTEGNVVPEAERCGSLSPWHLAGDLARIHGALGWGTCGWDLAVALGGSTGLFADD